MAEKLKQQVMRQIEEAFSQISYPGDENISPEQYEGEKLREHFQGKHWQEIDLNLIIYHRNDIPFLTSAGFRFYLPAFMLAVLSHYKQVDTLPDVLINSLIPPENADHKTGLPQRFQHFTLQERQAVHAFLEIFMHLHNDARSQYRHLNRALRFWK